MTTFLLLALLAAPGPVASFGFDEGSGNLTGGGTIAGATWANGKFGKALAFNGASRVTFQDYTALRLSTAMTLEAWVNPTVNSAGWRDVIMKGQDLYFLMGTTSPNGRPGFGGTFDGGHVYGTASLALNTWTHLAGTYDGATMRLFVNGAQVASKARTGAIASTAAALTIGGDPFFGQGFSGLIDEVRIYNRALTASEIQADMVTPIGAAPPPPDTTAPTAPASIAALVGGQQVALAWAAATDNVGVTQYLVDRGGVQIAMVPGLSFQDPGLPAGSYSYRVRARDLAGNVGPYSPTATAIVQPPPPPPPPSFVYTWDGPPTVDLCGNPETVVEAQIFLWPAGSDPYGLAPWAASAGGISPAAGSFDLGPELASLPAGDYDARIRWRDQAGNWSPWSMAVVVTKP